MTFSADMDTESRDRDSIPMKRVRGECLIHCSNDDSEFVSYCDLNSRITLLDAAEIRKYANATDLAKD